MLFSFLSLLLFHSLTGLTASIASLSLPPLLCLPLPPFLLLGEDEAAFSLALLFLFLSLKMDVAVLAPLLSLPFLSSCLVKTMLIRSYFPSFSSHWIWIFFPCLIMMLILLLSFSSLSTFTEDRYYYIWVSLFSFVLWWWCCSVIFIYLVFTLFFFSFFFSRLNWCFFGWFYSLLVNADDGGIRWRWNDVMLQFLSYFLFPTLIMDADMNAPLTSFISWLSRTRS